MFEEIKHYDTVKTMIIQIYNDNMYQAESSGGILDFDMDPSSYQSPLYSLNSRANMYQEDQHNIYLHPYH